MKEYCVIGLMSGTSIDGVDLVYVNFKFDKIWKFKIINSKTYPYSESWKSNLKTISKKNLLEINKIDEDYTNLLSKYVIKFINEFSIKNIDFISSHGHTALHDPENSFTFQRNLGGASNRGPPLICGANPLGLAGG